MESKSVTDMLPEDRRKALIRISQFVLRDDIQKVRDDIQDNIVEIALYWSPSEQEVSITEIKERLTKELDLTLTNSILTNITERLVKKSSLEFHSETGKYFLREDRRSQISRVVREKEQMLDEIEDLLRTKTEEKYLDRLSPEQKKEIIENFYSYLASLFVERSEAIAKILTGMIPDLKSALPRQIFESTIRRIPNEKIREAYHKAFLEVIDNPTESFLKFLFSVSQNLICIQVLNLDPTCQKLQKNALSEKVLFLDTNVIISLVCERDPYHQITKDLIDLTLSLGTKFVVTEKTIEEYSKVLEDANKSPKILKSKENRSTRLLKDPFILSFISEKDSLPSQTWEGYYLRMKQIGSVLQNKFRIETYKEEHDDIKEKPSFSEIADQVTRCYQAFRHRPKTIDVAEHDAFHLLLVRELRKNEPAGVLGPKYWFITTDTTLLCVDRAINRKLDYSDKTPSSMLSEIWLEMISPFLSSTGKEKSLDLFGMLLKKEFATIPFKITSEDLAYIQGDWMQYDWLEDQDIERIIGEKWLKQYLEKVKNAEYEGDKKEVESLASLFARKMSQELEKVKDEKLRSTLEERTKIIKFLDYKDRYEIPELKKSLQERQTTLEAQTTRITQQEATIKEKEDALNIERKKSALVEIEYKRKWRTITGYLGIVLVVTSLVLILLMTSGLWQSGPTSGTLALGCLGMGCILLLMTISYKQVKGKLP
jgi:hypothetical protein